MIKTKKCLFLLLIFYYLTTATCASVEPAEKNVSPEILKPKHLIFIGLDGWGGDYVPKANMPNIKRMMMQGASTLNMICVMPSDSKTNWPVIFTGNPPKIEKRSSIFKLFNDKNPETNAAFYFQWVDLQNLCDDERTEKKRIITDHELAKITVEYIIENKPAFFSVIFTEPDSTGHNKLWGSAAYYSKLAQLDGFIAEIEQAVKDAGIYDDTVFIFSADHGGILKGHGFNSPRQRKIPFIIFGKTIKENYTITPSRSIRDIAPTMALLLGLEIPSDWSGVPLFEIFK